MADLITTIRGKLDKEPGPLPMHLRIALERITAGLGVSHCARAMGWPPSRWQRVEAGARTISEEEVPLIAAVLGITDARLRGLQATLTPGRKRSGRRPKMAERLAA